MKLSKKYLLIIIGSILCIAVGSISRWFITPSLFQLKDDFSYQAQLFSKDNLFNIEENRFNGEIQSKSTFTYQVDSVTDNTLCITNHFDVKKPTGETIFEVSRKYGILKSSGAHQVNYGDQDRQGYLFSPIPAPKTNYTYWHINYNTPIEMQFVETNFIEGLEVFHYTSNFKVDQTKELSFLPRVSVDLGISLDVTLDLFIEPTTGHLIKYDDQAIAWYYQLDSKQLVHPWNKFSNTFTYGSIREHIDYAEQKLLAYQIYRNILPAISCILLLLLIAYNYRSSRRVHNMYFRTTIIVSLSLIAGLGFSYYVYNWLNNSVKQKKYLETEQVSHQIWSEIQKQVNRNIEILDILRFNKLSKAPITKELFNSIGMNSIKNNSSIQGVSWLPKVKHDQRDAFEKQWQTVIPDFYIWQRDSSGNKIPSTEREFYFPVLFIEPMSNNAAAIGFDIASNKKRLSTIFLADSLKDIAITEPISLVQEESNAKSILIMNPVFEKDEQGIPHLTGLFNGIFRIPNLVFQAITNLNIHPGIAFSIHDVTKEPKLIYEHELGKGKTSELGLTKNLNIANRVWKLDMEIADSYLSEIPVINTMILLLGILLTLIGAYIFYREGTDKKKELMKMNAELVQNEDELKRYTLQLQNSNKELEQFAYIVSHDLQEPLRSISMITSILEEKIESGDYTDSDKDINYIQKGVARMQLFTKNLLEYSRISSNKKLERLNILELYDEAKENLKGLIKETGTSFQYLGYEVQCMGYRTEVLQLFQNLIGNAIKYRSPDRAPKIRIIYSETETHHVFTVQDNGVGIAAEDMKVIFNIFERLPVSKNIDGSGIGLAICHKITEIHGGTLTVNSELGVGSEFTFSIDKNLS